MSFDARMIHTIVIERPNDGAVNEYNDITTTYVELATVKGLVQPKRAREIAQLNEAGAVASTYTIYMRPTEVQPSDRLRVDDGAMAGTYEIDSVRNAAGLDHHFEIDARMVAV